MEFRANTSRGIENKTTPEKFLAATYEASGDKDEAKIIRRIQRAEKVKKVFQKCRKAMKKNQHGGLASLLVPEDPEEDPKACDNWRRVECPEEIVALLQERNQKHFGQSKECNLTSDPFDFTMEFEGVCHRAEAILNGVFSTDPDLCPGVDQGATEQESNIRELSKLFFEALQFVDSEVQDTIDYHLSEEEFKGKISKWDERTSTSPGTNMHLGHLKAYWARHSLVKGSDEEKELESARQSILEGHLILLNYALKFGYSFDSWKMVVNTMLEKEPGNPKIHRLRVIHLYEADYTLVLAVKWRQLLRSACANGFVNENQFGSVSGKEALDAVFLRELEYEMTRMTRKPLVHFDNDATACYDRINVGIANVISRKYGMHRKVCIVYGRTLAEARYHLKTKLGISDEYVKHSRLHPWFGGGQGAGNTAHLWALISGILLDKYDDLAGGALYESPDGKWSVTLKAISFVDDVRNTVNEFGNNEVDLDELVKKAEKDSQLWHDLLWVGNQKLELPKCGYNVMNYEFLPSGEPQLENNPGTQLTVNDHKGVPLVIDQWPNDKAVQYLGCKKSISNQTTQFKVLKDKCDGYAQIVNCSHLNRTEAQAFYFAIYRLSVGYALPSSHFNAQQLQKIQSKSHQAMVSKSGYARSTPTAVILGPYYLGGAAFFHLIDDQGYGQLKLYVKFWRSPASKPGKMLRVTMAWAQICVGTSVPIMQDTSTPLPHLEAEWLASLRQFLCDTGASIETTVDFIAKRQRENDLFLMDVVLQSGKFKPAQIKRVNYCRLYLGVLLLSDIVNANGEAIDPAMYSGMTQAKTTKHRVNQKRPNDKAWAQWRRLLHLLAFNRHNLKLRVPLGKWLVPWAELRRQWPFLLDATTARLFHYTDLGYTQHEKLTYDFDKEPNQAIINPEIPRDAVPVDVNDHGTVWTVRRGYSQSAEPEQAQTDPVSIYDLFPILDQWEQHLLFDLDLQMDEKEIWTVMTTEKCYIATDGSAPEGKGSFGWVISDTSGTILAQCKGPVFGAKITSYRAEGYGILSVLRFLARMKQVHHTGEQMNQMEDDSSANRIFKHDLVCDNKSMVNKVKEIIHYKTVYPNATMDSEWDVLAEIRATMLELLEVGQPTMDHIKGHQDREKPFEQLSLKAQLNCRADWLADEYLQENPDLVLSRVPILPSSGCQLHLPHGTVTHNVKQEMQHARSVPPLKTRMCKKNGWSNETFDDIDWGVHGLALKRLQKHRTTLVKYLHDWLPVGKRVHQYDKKYPKSCPSCQAPTEDTDHLWMCQGLGRDQWRRESRSAMLKTMNDLDTAPPLQELYLEALQAMMEGRDPNTIRVDPAVADVAAAQASIGWKHILKGRFSKSWKMAQERYLGNRKTNRNNGSTWATKIAESWFLEWLKLWKLRNEDRHGRDGRTRLQAEERQALRELQQFYTDNDGIVVERLQWIFDTPLETRMEWTTGSIRAWINAWKPVVDESYPTELEAG